ncbi:MAG: permease prefix domain 1-containing protein, partial [Desulfobacteraceae bacterium]
MNFHIREFFQRICSIFRKRKLDEDLSEELASHIEMAIEDNIREGMNPEEARRQALIRFGGIDVTSGAFLGQCLNLDLHYTTCG